MTQIKHKKTKLTKAGIGAAGAATGAILIASQPANAQQDPVGDLADYVATGSTLATAAVGVGIGVIGFHIGSVIVKRVMSKT